MRPAPVPGVLETSTRHRDGVRRLPPPRWSGCSAAPLDDGCFILVTADQARRDAARSTRRWRTGRPSGPLDGLPMAIKDCIDVAGVSTTNGSLVAGSSAPARADAGIVRMLRQQGAVVVGKTNQSELAFSGIGLNPHFGSPRNPISRARAAGHRRFLVGFGRGRGRRTRAARHRDRHLGLGAGAGRVLRSRRLQGQRGSVPAGRRQAAVAHARQPGLPHPHGGRPAARRGRTVAVAGDVLPGPPIDPKLFVVPDDEIVTACDPDVRAWFDRQVDELARLDGVVVEARRLPVLAEAQALMDTQRHAGRGGRLRPLRRAPPRTGRGSARQRGRASSPGRLVPRSGDRGSTPLPSGAAEAAGTRAGGRPPDLPHRPPPPTADRAR